MVWSKLLLNQHILEISCSCIDFIFSNQPNLIMDSLHSKSHHRSVYWKLNLKMEYPQCYTYEIWAYDISDLSNCSIGSFYWWKSFSGKNVHEEVELFNRTLLNIFHNLLANKIFLWNDRDPFTYIKARM